MSDVILRVAMASERRIAGTIGPLKKRLLSDLAKAHREKVVKEMETFDFLEAWEELGDDSKVRDAFFRYVDERFDWDRVIDYPLVEKALDDLLRPLYHRATFDEESMFLQVHRGNEIEISFELWGEHANPDNPDERANADRAIESRVNAILGGDAFYSDHDLQDDDWGFFRFVYKCRVSLKIPTKNYLMKLFPKELDQLVEKYRQRAE